MTSVVPNSCLNPTTSWVLSSMMTGMDVTENDDWRELADKFMHFRLVTSIEF